MSSDESPSAMASWLHQVARWLAFQVTWQITMILGLFYFRLRVSGVSSFPRNGAVMVLTNHQSFLDPPLIGVTLPRQVRYAARSTLFRGVFAKYISLIGAIPLDREGATGKGLRESLRALTSREALVFFPEGTRTSDGLLAPLQRGTGLLIRRSGAQVVLGGIAGAYEAWPRRALFPRPEIIWIHYRAWSMSEAKSNSEADLLPALQQALQEAIDEANKRRDAYLRSRSRG